MDDNSVIYTNNSKAKTQVKRRKNYISNTAKYYILQRLVGIILIALGILSAVIAKEGTALVMMLLVGFSLIFSKEKLLTIPEHKNSKHNGKSNQNRRNF